MKCYGPALNLNRIKLKYQNPLFICSFYRGNKDDDLKPWDDLSKALDHVSQFSTNNTDHSVCAWRFQPGNIDWQTVLHRGPNTLQCSNLLNVLSEYGLDQVHKEATRKEYHTSFVLTNLAL